MNNPGPANRQRVLDAIYEQVGDDTTRFVALWDVRAALDLSDDEMANAVDFLEGQGLITTIRTGTGQRTPLHGSIAHRGVLAMEEREQEHLQRDKFARVAAARSALLRWLWRQKYEVSVHMPVVGHFREDDSARFDGRLFTEDEVDRASAYLYQAGLIQGVTVMQAAGPVRAEITHKGDQCVEQFNADVTAYQSREQGGGDVVFHIANNSGNIAANSNNFTQNATSQAAFDPEPMLAFVRLVQQLAPALSPEPAEREALLAHVQELQNDASAPAPDRGRLKRVADGVMSLLHTLASSPDVQRLAIEAGEQAIQHL